MGMNCSESALLEYIYPSSDDVYLKGLTTTSAYSARATFVFGHNPRTSDFTHVGAAEMLAGIGQAAYCMTNRYAPQLLDDRAIANTFFRQLDIKFCKMLAPHTEASLDIDIKFERDGVLPQFHVDGFVSGTLTCDSAQRAHSTTGSKGALSDSTSSVLRSFYNNGSALTLKQLQRSSSVGWKTSSSFERDRRKRLCNYTTTTQVIVGLSQVAFAVVGDTLQDAGDERNWSRDAFINTMSDQALVKLRYQRDLEFFRDLNLSAELVSSRSIRECQFIRLKLGGDLNGTMDNMLSPRVPVRSSRNKSQE